MNNQKIDLNNIKNLCSEFEVEFKISTDKDLFIIYHFGDKVAYKLGLGDDFTLYHFIEVLKRLSATYPEKVLR